MPTIAGAHDPLPPWEQHSVLESFAYRLPLPFRSLDWTPTGATPANARRMVAQQTQHGGYNGGYRAHTDHGQQQPAPNLNEQSHPFSPLTVGRHDGVPPSATSSSSAPATGTCYDSPYTSGNQPERQPV